MKRVTFLIDGFNLYHSILKLKGDTGYCTKWLNLSALCKSYIHLFGKDAYLEAVHYFSAIPYYLKESNPDRITKHQSYIACLDSKGVLIELGRFKQKDVYCDRCKSMIIKHEEKETDVAIAIKLLEICFTDSCEIAVIVSGDTDLVPAVEKCKVLCKSKKVIFAFPYARKNKELSLLASDSFSINKNQYIKHQLENPVQLSNGKLIYKPPRW